MSLLLLLPLLPLLPTDRSEDVQAHSLRNRTTRGQGIPVLRMQHPFSLRDGVEGSFDLRRV